MTNGNPAGLVTIRQSLLLVTAATAAAAACRAASAFTSVMNVVDIRGGDRIRIERHDRIRQRLTLVRLHPRFDVATGTERQQQRCRSCRPRPPGYRLEAGGWRLKADAR